LEACSGTGTEPAQYGEEWGEHDWELADRAFSLKKGAGKEKSDGAGWNVQCEKQEIQQFSHAAVQPSSHVGEKCDHTIKLLWLTS